MITGLVIFFLIAAIITCLLPRTAQAIIVAICFSCVSAGFIADHYSLDPSIAIGVVIAFWVVVFMLTADKVIEHVTNRN